MAAHPPKPPHKGGQPTSLTKKETSAKEIDLARQREEKITELRSIFVTHGNLLANHIVGEFIRYGHLKNSLRMLSLLQPPELDQQCELILRHLEQVGPRGLLDKITTRATSGAPNKPKDDTGEIAAQILNDAEDRLMKRVLSKQPGAPPKDPAGAAEAARKSQMDAACDVPDDVPPSQAATQLKPGKTAQSAPAADAAPAGDGVTICPKTGRPMKDGKYIERRSGSDRRVGKDRRANLDVVFKNRRFGGDRRSGQDRRKNS